MGGRYRKPWHTSTDSLIVNCMGLRSEESPARAKKQRICRNESMTNSKRTVWDWLPIHDWTTEKVTDYLQEKELPLHPVYTYLSRFSCQICIFHSQQELLKVRDNNPSAFYRIAKIEREIGFSIKPNFFLDEL